MAVAAILRDAWRAAGLPGEGRSPPRPSSFARAAGGRPRDRGQPRGRHGGDDRRDGGGAGRGSRIALITGSAASPAGVAADVVVATVEMDRSWCHTVGYVSPIVAATAAPVAAGGPAAAAALEERVPTGSRRRTPPRRAVAPRESIAATIAGASHLLVVASGVDRVTGARARAQGRGGVVGPVRHARPRDVPPRPPAGDGPRDGARAHPDRAGRPRCTGEARAPGARRAAATWDRPAAILGADAAAGIPAELTPGGRIVVPEAPGVAAAGPRCSARPHRSSW